MGGKGQTSRLVLRADVYCGIAGIFWKLGRLKEALARLDAALSCADRLPKSMGRRKGEVHLDLCALLSQQGEHNKALDHACQAVRAIQGSLESNAGHGGVRRRQEALAIAQHNVAVELEHLGRVGDAMEAYQQ